MCIHSFIFYYYSYQNDIAILKLLRPSVFNSYIWPICMPPMEEDWARRRAVVIGWGTMFFGGPYSPVLMEVSIPIWTNARCQEQYAHKIFDTVVCAGSG